MRFFRHGRGERPEARAEGLPAFDPLLLGGVVLLVAVGAVMVYSASAVEAGRKLGRRVPLPEAPAASRPASGPPCWRSPCAKGHRRRRAPRLPAAGRRRWSRSCW